ncbi:hypothetical protein CFA81_22410 [Salmonella enterica]|nr:hypothetical protein [Salmonella enterica]EAY7458362.1 hypothetical protein [Salmonella enterica]EAZ6967096.1 hypothetical protein [Salmonella enterica]EKE0143483.1 hypothetical protein [Salmonella enterica]ELS0073365.1 hypothetical protein [Salmonella enterica]
MQFITVIRRVFYRLLDACTSGEWITRHTDWIANHTGYLSFCAEVREEEGKFHAFVCKRTGYTAQTFSYERVIDCGTFDTFRHALSVAYSHACHLAYLRYAWAVTDYTADFH